MSVIVSQLTKVFGVQKAVDNISFSANPGEVLGFLGPNGAGKSTTMKIATGFLPPTSGQVKVCGMDVSQQSIEVRKQIGYLPEHNPLYLDMYVHEYLAFSGNAYGVKGAALKKKIESLVSLTGLTKEQNKKLGALSKGYRQRVGLASALVHDPKVLILDEPTTGLDPNQIVEIRALIKEIGKQKTVIFSTHIMQEVQAICDRVVIISKGQIVADQKIGELTKQGNGGKKLKLKFQQATKPTWITAVEGVIKLSTLSSNEYWVEIESGKEELTQALIFKTAAEKMQILTGIEWEQTNLESVFQQLTK